MTRLFLFALIALGWFNLYTAGRDYGEMRDLTANNGYSATATVEQRQAIVRMHEKSMFAPWSDQGLMRVTPVTPEFLKEKADLNERLFRTWPSPDNAYRQAALLALAGREEEGKRIWRLAVGAYPSSRGEVLASLNKIKSDVPALRQFTGWAVLDQGALPASR